MKKTAASLVLLLAAGAAAQDADKSAKEKPPGLLKKMLIEVGKKKSAAIKETTLASAATEKLEAAFDGIMRKDFAGVLGAAEVYAKGSVYLIKAGDRFLAPNEVEDRQAALGAGFKNPSVVLAEIGRLMGGATYLDDEKIEERDFKVVLLKGDEQHFKRELADIRHRMAAAIKQAVGGYELGNINSYFDEKKSTSSFKVWVGKTDLLVHKIEWDFKPMLTKEKLPPGVPNIQISGTMTILFSKWDEEVPFEIPRLIKSKFGVK